MMWLLELVDDFSFFRREYSPRSAKEVILWWEKQRIIYNFLVGLCGALAGLLMFILAWVAEQTVGEPIGIPDSTFFAFIAVIFFGIAANVCYTGGWIAELLVRRIWKESGASFGRISFGLGTIFSMVLTFVPFLSCLMKVFVKIFHHG